MGSSYKTDYLNLNKWIASDKPKRTDFVQDNIIIDSAINKHIEEFNGHISVDERIKWNEASKKSYVMGTYAGNGYTSREISLDFVPSFVIAFKSDSLLFSYQNLSNAQWSYVALGTKNGSSLGISLNNTGFIVNQRTGNSSDAIYYKMNESGSTYCYIAFR